MKTLFTIFVLFFTSFTLTAEEFVNPNPPDSCLKMIWPDNYDDSTGLGYINPDSVMVDSCKDSETYGELYSKRYYSMALPMNFYPFDDFLVYGQVYTVDDISDDYPEFKAQFEIVKQNMGPVYFMKLPPFFADIPDSIMLESTPSITFYFDRYHYIVYARYYIEQVVDSVTSVNCYERQICIIGDVEGIKKNDLLLYPNPAATELRLRFESRVKEAAIVDLYGRTVIELSLEQIQALNSGSETVINVSAIEPGAYFLKADGRFARKLIIQR